MRTRLLSTFVLTLALAAPAAAQYGAKPLSDRATGESYHVEVSGNLWYPAPDIVLSSESLGILGTDVDFVNNLGIEKTRFTQLKIVLRPATKHKFRFEYTPIHATADSTVQAQFVFNGQRYTVGLPVNTEVVWKAYRFAYEYDFVYRDRGFVGVVLEAKYTDIQATLSASFAGIQDVEFTHAKAPIPAIGIIGRGYVLPNVSITGEFGGFKLPSSINDKYAGKYWDFDLYGTVNFTNFIGAQIGYRSLDVYYKVKTDSGTLQMKGPYVGGVVRF